MGLLTDIIGTWRNPKAMILAKTAELREDRALATLMGAAALIFISEWPYLARQAHLDPSVPMNGLISGALMAVVFILPLVMYTLALLSHWIAKLIGGRGTGFGARMALFQAMLAASPVVLAYGLLRGVQGDSGLTVAVGLVSFLGFLWMWLTMLVTVERG